MRPQLRSRPTLSTGVMENTALALVEMAPCKVQIGLKSDQTVKSAPTVLESSTGNTEKITMDQFNG